MNKELLMERLSHIYDLLSDLIEDLDENKPEERPRTTIEVQIGEFEIDYITFSSITRSFNDPVIKVCVDTANRERIRFGFPACEETHVFVTQSSSQTPKCETWTHVIPNKEFKGKKENG